MKDLSLIDQVALSSLGDTVEARHHRPVCRFRGDPGCGACRRPYPSGLTLAELSIFGVSTCCHCGSTLVEEPLPRKEDGRPPDEG